MPTFVNGTANWREAIPIPADGDLADEASIAQAIQQVANNLRWLYELTTSRGVLAVRHLPDIATLKALRDMADGQAAYVASRGLYLYLDPNAATEALPWVVAPTLGTGRWFHPLEALRNVPSGIATLDAAGRIPRDSMPLSLVQPPIYVEPTGYGVNPNIAWTNVPTAEARVPNVRAGDLLEVDSVVVADGVTASNEVLFLRLLIGTVETKPSKAKLYPGPNPGTIGGAVQTLALGASYACLPADETAGGVTVRVQMSASGLHPGSVNVNFIRIRHLRP